MLPNACPWPSEKSCKWIRYQWILVLHPSLRSKFMRIRKIFLIEVVSKRLDKHSSSFLQIYLFKHHLLLWNPHETRSRRWCHSDHFILNAFQVSQFLQTINVLNILIVFYDFLNLWSKLFLNLRMLANEVNHASEKICCSVSSSQQKCAKLFDQFLFIIWFLALKFLLKKLLNHVTVCIIQRLLRIHINLWFYLVLFEFLNFFVN